MKLYEYDEALESMYRAVENEDGVDPETGMIFDISLLDQWEKERNEKIESALLYAEQMKADAGDIDDYIKRLQIRSRAKKNTAESIKNYVIQSMQGNGESRFETQRIRATLSITKANKLIKTDEKLIPPQYYRAKMEFNDAAIKEALKAGEVVPGAELVDTIRFTVK